MFILNFVLCLVSVSWRMLSWYSGSSPLNLSNTLPTKQLSAICLGKSKLNGGSIIDIDKAKTTLTRVCEITLTGSAPLV
jgi:hypothetical protein